MRMGKAHYFTNQLLVAMPSLNDPNFSQTVTLICEHSEKGALGIVINRPMDMRLGEVLEQLSLEARDPVVADWPILRGGPVHPDRGFVLHRPTGHRWDSSLDVSEHLQVTTSRDILESIARGDGPREGLMALGYAGWEAGQLEEEVLGNSWLTVPCDEDLLFRVPFEQRWSAAARLLGIDPSRLSHLSGHA